MVDADIIGFWLNNDDVCFDMWSTDDDRPSADSQMISSALEGHQTVPTICILLRGN